MKLMKTQIMNTIFIQFEWSIYFQLASRQQTNLLSLLIEKTVIGLQFVVSFSRLLFPLIRKTAQNLYSFSFHVEVSFLLSIVLVFPSRQCGEAISIVLLNLNESNHSMFQLHLQIDRQSSHRQKLMVVRLEERSIQWIVDDGEIFCAL